MDWPTALSFDPQRNELFVANDAETHSGVRRLGQWRVAPLRVLKGPKSLVSNPTGVYFDQKNEELWVANFGNHHLNGLQPTASGDTPRSA